MPTQRFPGRRGVTVPLSVAPMMERTDRHYRTFARLLSRRTLLYTEMVPAGTILHGDRARHLDFDPFERPLALQLGGDDPAQLAECAKIAEDWGYDEVNLNVGCPSPRVKRGSFGACLMAQPEVVARGVEAMRAAVSIPVTVKHRIGIDDLDRYEDMLRFVDVCAAAGADRFSVHARKAWLDGLSPKENRTIPPLRYDDVYRLKRERPDLPVEINGGILTLDETLTHLAHVDAVMIGRAAYDDPYGVLAEADQRLFGETYPVVSRAEVAQQMHDYAARRFAEGTPVRRITVHVQGLFSGVPGSRRWKRTLSQHTKHQRPEVLLDALAAVG